MADELDPWRWRARVIQDYGTDPLGRFARLIIFRYHPGGTIQYLAETTLTIITSEDGGKALPEPVGILIEPEMLPAIGEAIANWQGPASHQATEVKVLREWLTVERGRVDHQLDSGRG